MIFVTGTDTGCGKTTVGRALCAALSRRGTSVGVTKPVESGCEVVDGRRVAADAEALAHAAGCSSPAEDICPNRLLLPASPERAADAEGVTIDPRSFLRALEAVSLSSDFVLAEGAGGLMVPVTPDLMMIDLPELLRIPLLLVSRDALGTVNHTLLSLEAIRSRRLPLAGVIFSGTESSSPSLENVQAVETYGRVRCLGTLPWLPGADDELLARAAEDHLDIDGLLSELALAQDRR